MSVILLYPKTGWDVPGVTRGLPLAPLCLAAPLVREGYGVRIIDQRVDPHWRDTLKEELVKGALCVGISSMTGIQVREGLEASRLTRAVSPQTPVIWGGVHPSLLPEQTMRHPLVDLVVVGEGEETFSSLVKALSAGEDPGDLPGLWRKENGQRGYTGASRPPDLDRLPPLPYHLVNPEDYFTSRGIGEKELILQTSRGCPYRCAYCYNTVFHRGRWRGQRPERVVDQIQELVGRYGIDALAFEEDNFFCSPKRATEIARLLKERGSRLRLRAEARVDSLMKWDDDFLTLLEEAGLRQLYIGVESGADRVLERIRKEITVEQVLAVNRRLRCSTISPHYSFMAGFPEESLEEMKATLRLMLRLLEENPRAKTTFLQVFTPYPGTELARVCQERGYPTPKTLEEWGSSNWNSLELSRWLPGPERRFLAKATFFTLFLDPKNVQRYSRHTLAKFLARAYSFIVRLRCRHHVYSFMPEVFWLRKIKNLWSRYSISS